MPGYSSDRERLLNRLRRIEGQVRGLQRMVEEDTYCIDVLTQIASVTKALQGVGMGLLDDHIRHCVRDAAHHGTDQHGPSEDVAEADGAADGVVDGFDAKVEEVMSAVGRMLRT
jgi:CsoR family transcriptional regulator, copper-sensing transcriptional repressor